MSRQLKIWLIAVIVQCLFSNYQAHHLFVYDDIDFGVNKPSKDLFYKAIKGYEALVNNGTIEESKQVITIVDLSLSSNTKRLWTIDLGNKTVLFNTYVAHGKNSGQEYARSFSNKHNSNKSSLGFYKTAEIYYGKHGLSLNLDGLEPGFNDNARSRRVVMHGADYVSEEFIAKYGRLGRSFGCPSVSVAIHEELIDKIKGGTCLFMYYPDDKYLEESAFI